MERWQLLKPKSRKKSGHRLANSSRTKVVINKRLCVNIDWVLKQLEERDFPFAYIEGLKEINFTIIPERSRAMGYYFQDKIVLDARPVCFEEIIESLIHEVAHHVENREAVSSILREERLSSYKHLQLSFSSRNNDEYLALGFERFYSQDPKHREMLEEKNPQLYCMIMLLHLSYSAK